MRGRSATTGSMRQEEAFHLTGQFLQWQLARCVGLFP